MLEEGSRKPLHKKNHRYRTLGDKISINRESHPKEEGPSILTDHALLEHVEH